MEFQSVSQIKEAGFSGFVTVESLFKFGYTYGEDGVEEVVEFL